jgi:transcriptional regulator with XRE-family HTH domain
MTRHKFSTLRDKMSVEAQARIRARATEALLAMPLAELRRARELTQAHIANNLKVNQGWISKIEHQADMYISTLRDYIEAMGGELEIVARFKEGPVQIDRFGATSSNMSQPEDKDQAPAPATPDYGTGTDLIFAPWTPPNAPSEFSITTDERANTWTRASAATNTPARANRPLTISRAA